MKGVGERGYMEGGRTDILGAAATNAVSVLLLSARI